MGLIFTESFDFIPAAPQRNRWSGIGWGLSTATKRTGRASGVLLVNQNAQYRVKSGEEHATLIAGVAFYPTGGAGVSFLFKNGGGATNQIRVSKTRDTDGAIELWNGSGWVLLASLGGSVVDTAWNYVEVKVVFHASAGAVTVRLNGSVIGTVTGINTIYSGTTLDSIELSTITGGSGYYDDFYLCNGVAPAGNELTTNDFLGQISVVCLMPNAAGDVTELTPTGDPNNYANVNKQPPDSASFNAGATDGLYDLYQLQDGGLAGTDVVLGVQVTRLAVKDTGASKFMRNLIKHGSTEWESASVALPEGNPSYVSDMRLVNPATTNPFAPAELDTLQAGAKVKDS